MNYTSPDTHIDPDSSLESIQDTRKTLPIDEAAIHMGLKPDTLRKRLQAGTEDGFKGRDNRWNVYVSGIPEVQEIPEISRTSRDVDDSAVYALLQEVQHRLIDMKDSQNYLKAHIVEKDKALAAKDEMIRELIAKFSSRNDSRNPSEIAFQALEDEVGNVASIADVLALMSSSELQSTGQGLGWVAGELLSLSDKLEAKQVAAFKAVKTATRVQSG